jgi:hypothetical protein
MEKGESKRKDYKVNVTEEKEKENKINKEKEMG